eukprot:4341253-Amphidinium_carterae.1
MRPLQWVARQRTTVASTDESGSSRVSSRVVAWLLEFGPDALDERYLNAGEGHGLEAWRRLANECDPTSSMRRVSILGMVQNTCRCDKIKNLGQTLEEMLTRKRQCEEFIDKDGAPCRVSDDSLIAAMCKLMPKTLEET